MDLRQMLAMLRHRGPDQFGVYLNGDVGLGSARLSIIDLSTGQQPITNEDETKWIVFNGEIFNYLELREDLIASGHRMATQSDTEVIVHAFEAYGRACAQHFNGQFAFAIWDEDARALCIARDRLGICPLFYTVVNGRLLFASEIKAILAHEGVSAEINPVVMHEVFSFWSPLSPHTIFKDIFQLPPGHILIAQDGDIKIEPYWQLDFGQASTAAERPLEDYLAEFRALLIDATRIRLRADVPVGAYLSGGLDSSTTSAIIRNYTHNRLDTFSITFSDPAFDESMYQQTMADFLGTNHHIVHATHESIGAIFPEVIWHTEVPILRTSPAPMYLLSRLVRETGFKVVMTGEGADEFLAGYDIFKEDRIRRFWARQPDSQIRPLLLKKLYPDIADLQKINDSFLAAFFRQGLEQTERLDYSHALRWRNTARSRRFFSEGLYQAAASWETQLETSVETLGVHFPPGFRNWHPLERAQYLEIQIFLSQYLLSSQADRVVLGNSVEGRYPFLDTRVIDFCNRLPTRYKLFGLTEKFMLKRFARDYIPDEIWQRVKRPYRAPIHRSFFHEQTPDYVRELLSPAHIRSSGYFRAEAVEQLIAKINRGMRLGETDDMALVGILSTQLIHHQFISHFEKARPLASDEDVKVIRRVPIRSH
jgi:asparagine synthase (glutamine-hydrolysing)